MADDVSDEVVRAKAGELEGALSRWKLEGFDPVAGLDLATAARLTAGLEPRVDSEGTPLIIVDMDGEYSYSVHLSTQAVAELGRSDFGAMLGAAVAAFPDVAAIVQPLSDFIATHAGEIEGQAAGGPVRLEGTVPSPFVVPVPESPVYWEVEHQIAEEESGSGRQSDDSDLDKQLKDQLGDGNGGWEGNPNKDPLHRKHRGSGI